MPRFPGEAGSPIPLLGGSCSLSVTETGARGNRTPPSITTHATEKAPELQSDEGIGRHPTRIQTPEALLPALAVPAPLLSRIRLSLSKGESVGIDYVNAQSASLHVHSKCLTKRAPGG